MSENPKLSKLRQLFQREAELNEQTGLNDLPEPPDQSSLDDPLLDAHVLEAQQRRRELQSELEKIPTIDEVEAHHTAYVRAWAAFKDSFYMIDCKIKELKTDNESVGDSLKMITEGVTPPRFPEDPVECLNILRTWVEKNTEKTVELMSLNQTSILETNKKYRSYEDIFCRFHKIFKAYSSIIEQQEALINKLCRK